MRYYTFYFLLHPKAYSNVPGFKTYPLSAYELLRHVHVYDEGKLYRFIWKPATIALCYSGLQKEVK